MKKTASLLLVFALAALGGATDAEQKSTPTNSVAGNTILATAAIVAGSDAPAWLTRTRLAARLVSHDGAVRLLGGWPDTDGGQLPTPRLAAPEPVHG